MKKLTTLFLALVLTTGAFANITFGPITATGATASQAIYPTLVRELRLVEVRAWGATWGGRTLTVQTSSDGGTTWIETGVSLSATGTDYFYAMPGDLVRVTASAGDAFSVTVRIR